MEKLSWCFKIKDGLKIEESNEKLSKLYLEQSKSSLLRAQNDLNEKDLLWATIAIYYAEYYALYSFLQKIGIKSENHACSIMVTGFLLGEDEIKTINTHKTKRIDAQYYIKVDQEDQVKNMLKEAKIFVSNFDEIISKIKDSNIKEYIHKLQLKLKE